MYARSEGSLETSARAIREHGDDALNPYTTSHHVVLNDKEYTNNIVFKENSD
jgi:hypothetical protein